MKVEELFDYIGLDNPKRIINEGISNGAAEKLVDNMIYNPRTRASLDRYGIEDEASINKLRHFLVKCLVEFFRK
jgi:hypothetical protein